MSGWCIWKYWWRATMLEVSAAWWRSCLCPTGTVRGGGSCSAAAREAAAVARGWRHQGTGVAARSCCGHPSRWIADIREVLFLIILIWFWGLGMCVAWCKLQGLVRAGCLLWSRRGCADRLRDGRSSVADPVVTTESGCCGGWGQKIGRAYQMSCCCGRSCGRRRDSDDPKGRVDSVYLEATNSGRRQSRWGHCMTCVFWLPWNYIQLRRENAESSEAVGWADTV